MTLSRRVYRATTARAKLGICSWPTRSTSGRLRTTPSRAAVTFTIPSSRRASRTASVGRDEPLELLRDAGAGIEGPRPLRDHRSDHVAQRSGAPSPARRLRREDRRRARPARPAGARRRGAPRARARRAFAATPPPVRSAACRALRAPLVDAHDHRRGRRPLRPGQQEEVHGARASGRERVEEERRGEHDGDRGREENRPQ